MDFGADLGAEFEAIFRPKSRSDFGFRGRSPSSSFDKLSVLSYALANNALNDENDSGIFVFT